MLERRDLDRIRTRIAGYFPDHEIYVRSKGHVRFIRISTGVQLKLAAAASFALCAWLAVSGIMLVSQYQVGERQAAIGAQVRAVNQTASKVAAYRATIDGKAEQLEQRQAFIDALASQYFGPKREAEKQPAKAVLPANAAQKTKPTVTARAILPDANRLEAIEEAQFAFADHIAAKANARADRTEKAVRRLGLNPDRLAGRGSGLGGPFVPFGGKSGHSAFDDPRFLRLSAALMRLDRLERAMLAVPSLRPALGSALSSSFGFRFDPFTRWPAMHQGQDFSGTRGQPIHAAAPGRIVRAGWWAGYGKAVEIDHGRGLRTRYGHMSGLDVKVGDRIERGAQIGRMGSTGRSTGTHLHFEVRIDGRAVNPRPFLEASADVLKIQTSVNQRIVGAVRAG